MGLRLHFYHNASSAFWTIIRQLYFPESPYSFSVFSSDNLGHIYEIFIAEKQKLTQQQLGERIGKKREYISSLEQGKTDMKLSTFMLIANALGLRFSLVVG